MIVWIIIIFGAIFGFIIGMAIKPQPGGTRYEWSEVWRLGFSAAMSGLIIGAVIGVLLSFFGIYEMGLSGLLGTLVLGIIGAVVVGALFFLATVGAKGLANLVGERMSRALTGLIVGLIIGAIVVLFVSPAGMDVFPEYLKFAEPVKEVIIKGANDLALFRYCAYADPRCPFIVPFDDPTIQIKKEELYVDMSFDEKKIKPDNTINLLVKLSIGNPKLAELRIKPKCYFKSKDKEKGGRELSVESLGSYSYGDEFRFPSTGKNEELNTQFYCSGEIPEGMDKNIYSEKIIIELERPVAVETTWPVWIGSKPRKGVVRSVMSFNAPYTISLASNNDMPFEEGKDYNFQVTIKRRADDVKFKRLESISVYFPEEIMAECEHFEGVDELEIREASYESLKEITQFDAEFDKFIFPCKLYVTAAPIEAVLAPIHLQAYYSVYSDYSTRIFKTI